MAPQYKINTYFYVEDIVPPVIITKFGPQCYRWVNKSSFDMLTKFREFINLPMTINDWANGGVWQNCGFRESSSGVGQALGEHYRAMAYDVHVKGWTAKDYQAFLLKAKTDKAYQKQLRDLGITILEEGTFDLVKGGGWIHISNAWTQWLKPDEIYFVPFK